MFQPLLRLGRLTPILKGPPSSPVVNCRKIFTTPVLYMVFESLMSVRLGGFVERSGVLRTTQFSHQKGLANCNSFLCVFHIPWTVDWRVGRRLGLCRLISAHPLKGSTIRKLSISSALMVLKVLCCLY